MISAKIPRFGARVVKAHNTIYQAEADGVVTCAFASTVGWTTQVAKAGSTTPPTTLVDHDYAAQNQWGNVSFAVRKGDYWKVETESGSAPDNLNFYWTPNK